MIGSGSGQFIGSGAGQFVGSGADQKGSDPTGSGSATLAAVQDDLFFCLFVCLFVTGNICLLKLR